MGFDVGGAPQAAAALEAAERRRHPACYECGSSAPEAAPSTSNETGIASNSGFLAAHSVSMQSPTLSGPWAEAPGGALYLVCSGIAASIVPASTRSAPPWITAYR